MIRRLSDKTLKKNGFKRVDYMQCYQKWGVIVSYGLIVAIGNKTAEGYHDYSVTTSRQVTRASGVSIYERRATWNILKEADFETLANEYIKNNIKF